MSHDNTAHVQPSKHSTDQVDGFLDMVEDNVEIAPGAGSPAIMPEVDPDGAVPPAPLEPGPPRGHGPAVP